MMKRCSKCGEDKPTEAFFRKQKSRDGYQARCRRCQTAYKVEWQRLNPERYAVHQRRYLYGLEPEQYEAMLVNQQGRCAICLGPLHEPHVDHDHITKRVRKLLCGLCNRMLGNARENPAILRSAALYLEEHDA